MMQVFLIQQILVRAIEPIDLHLPFVNIHHSHYFVKLGSDTSC